MTTKQGVEFDRIINAPVPGLMQAYFSAFAAQATSAV